MTTNPRPNRAQQTTLRAFLKTHSEHAGSLLKISIALGTFNALLMIASAYLVARSIHLVMFQQADLTTITPLLWPLAALILGRAVLLGFSQRLSAKAALKIKTAMRHTLLEKLTLLGPSYIEQHGHGATLNTLHNGVEALHDYYANYLPSVAYSALIPFAILMVIFPTDWKAGLIFLFTAPLIPFFMILVGHQAEQLNQQRWQQLAVLGNYFFDRLQGLTQLKLFNATKRELKQIAKISDDFRHATLSVLKIAFLSSFALEFLATISVALVAVIIGFRLFFGTLDFATGFVVLLLAPEFYLPLRQLGSHYHAKLEGISAAADMLKILNEPIPGSDNESSTRHNEYSPLTLERIEQLRIDNLNFHYPDSIEGVNNINLTFAGTGLYAIVGQSGAGKSTLLDCLLGFHPQVIAAITVNQQQLTQSNISQWQQHIAWIPQQPTLLFTTIKANLLLAKPDATAAQLADAAKQAGALEFINALPEGFDTHIGEQGEGLSGGQKQRIALARAFLKQAPILVLDEPTAHLDSQTEQSVQTAINHYAKDHLVIVIAHRLNTIEQAKKILVMKDGSVIEQGDFTSLLNQPGALFDLVNARSTQNG